jgi:S1-C subfamily serine protease
MLIAVSRPALILAFLLAPIAAAAQDTGILRVSVILADAAGNAVPIPRVLLLISANPSTAEPRRVRTGADGVAEVALPPGNYTVESDRPTALGGRNFVWTKMIDVVAGATTTLALSAVNADSDAGGDPGAADAAVFRVDAAPIFEKWNRSVVQVWTPTQHATGFVIDRGLIATSRQAIGDSPPVQVQFSSQLKVAGRVVASDRLQGVTLISVDPATTAGTPAVPIGCGGESKAAIEHDQRVVTIVAPMLEPKSAINGAVSRVETQAFQVDWRLGRGLAGSPVFDADARPIGITVPEDEQSKEYRPPNYVTPIGNACALLASAQAAMQGATPPPATPLRTELGLPVQRRTIGEASKTRRAPPQLSSSDFEITLVTPAMVRLEQTPSWRTDYGNWNDYVTLAPQVLFVRVTPQFEESVWKMLLRGAAMTQGVALPPMKNFNANFVRLRAFCGSTEVAPIHPFVIERPIADRPSIREGFYVFAPSDFGPQCGTVRFDLYSEKSPGRPDSRSIDPALFTVLS